jgi:YD repeat-containing protein
MGTGANDTRTYRFDYGTKETGNLHRITGVYDALGEKIITLGYDDQGALQTKTMGDGTISYTTFVDPVLKQRTTQTTDRIGTVTTITFDANGNILAKKQIAGGITRSSYIQYNDQGKPTLETMPRGNGIAYRYDSDGNVIEKRLQMNAGENSTTDLITTMTYDPAF